MKFHPRLVNAEHLHNEQYVIRTTVTLEHKSAKVENVCYFMQADPRGWYISGTPWGKPITGLADTLHFHVEELSHLLAITDIDKNGIGGQYISYFIELVKARYRTYKINTVL